MNTTENKNVDLVVDANVPYQVVAKFETVEFSDTGRELGSTVIDLSGSSFKGSVFSSLESNKRKLGDLTITTTDAKNGMVVIAMTKAIVDTLAAVTDYPVDKFNPRLRQVGVYDIILTKSDKTSYRILEGRVFINQGVTV